MDHSYSNEENERASKRMRIDESEPANTDNALSSPFIPLNMEQHLSIPMEIIFRQSASTKEAKPLLSYPEAELMLRINMISREINCLVELAIEALYKKRKCKAMLPTLLSHPLLRSLGTLSHRHGENHASDSLIHVQEELSRVLLELTTMVTFVKNFSVQNHIFAESLFAVYGENKLGEERKLLSDLEEEIIERCNEVLQLAEGHDCTETQHRPPMETFCKNLFGDSFEETQQHQMDTIREEDHHEESLLEGITLNQPEATANNRNSELPSDKGGACIETTAAAAVTQVFSTTDKAVVNDQNRLDVAETVLEDSNLVTAMPTANGSKLAADNIGIVQSQRNGADDVCLSATPPQDNAHKIMAIVRLSEEATVLACSKAVETKRGIEGQTIPPGQPMDQRTVATEVLTGQANIFGRESSKHDSHENRLDATVALLAGMTTPNNFPYDDESFMTSSPQRLHSSKERRGALPGTRDLPQPLYSSPEQERHQPYFFDLEANKSPSTKPPLNRHKDDMLNTQNDVRTSAGLSYSD